jgi:GntR family transcriptional regulator
MESIQVAGITFKLDPTKPFYEQIVEQVRGALARGEVALEVRMPSVRELAQLLKVNPNTVMRAYQDLERSGLLVTYRGQGTYTTTKQEFIDNIRQELADKAIREFSKAMTQLGFTHEQVLALMEEADWQ